MSSIARLLNVSRSTIYKYLPELKGGGGRPALQSSRSPYASPHEGSAPMPMDLIPARFTDAETDLPQIHEWCDVVLRGVPARLLLVGPIFSGKIHAAYAALRRLLQAGYPDQHIAVLDASDIVLSGTYEPAQIDQAPRSSSWTT